MKCLILSLLLVGLVSTESLPKCPKSGKGRLSSFQGDLFSGEPCIDDKDQVVIPETGGPATRSKIPTTKKKRPSLGSIMPGLSSIIPRSGAGGLKIPGLGNSKPGIRPGIRPGVRPGLNIGGSSFLPPLTRSGGSGTSIQSLKKKVYTLLDLSASASKTTSRTTMNNDPPGAEKCLDCVKAPISCCKTISDVAFPTIGVSAITNQTVNIVQEFPSLVQAVFFRACEFENQECNVVRGNCVQEFLPQSVFVIPETPIGGFFGQDFVLTESGCRCDATIYPPNSVDGNGQGEEREMKPRPVKTTTTTTTTTTEPPTTTTTTTTEAPTTTKRPTTLAEIPKPRTKRPARIRKKRPNKNRRSRRRRGRKAAWKKRNNRFNERLRNDDFDEEDFVERDRPNRKQRPFRNRRRRG